MWLARQGISVPCAVRFGAEVISAPDFLITGNLNTSGPNLVSAIVFLLFFKIKKIILNLYVNPY